MGYNPDSMDTIWQGGSVVTVDEEQPRAEAVLVRDKRIEAVGSQAEVRAAARPDAEVIDLEGCTLIPGFNDAHIHLFIMGDHANSITLHGLSKAEILERLGAAAGAGAADAGTKHEGGGATARDTGGGGDNTTASDTSPLLAYAWDYERCPDPHKRDLDEVFPNRPVILFQFSGHGAWVNSAALKLLQIDADTPDWEMGGPDRDENGELTGILREPSNSPQVREVRDAQWRDRENVRRGLRAALPKLAEHGITSIQDNTWFPWVLDEIKQLHRRGELTCRLSCWAYGKQPQFVRAFRRRRFNKDWFARGPVKYFWDGAFSSYTAFLTEPYADRPGIRGKGTEVDAIAHILRRATRRNRQIAAHSIGDAATAAYIDAMAQVATERPTARQLRHRIEHGQLIRSEDIPRIRDLGMIVSAQPHAASDPGKDRRLIGQERLRRAYPYRSLLDAGVPLAFGSDFPGEATFDPLYGMHLAVNREGGEAITATEALHAYTAGGAYAEWKEREKGRIRPGFLADLAVLSADPTAVDPTSIQDIQVDATVVDGRFVFEREGSALKRGRRA